LAFPKTHRQNDTLAFSTKLDSKYDGFTLTYYLSSAISVVGVFNASTSAFDIFETETDWTPGDYSVVGVVTNGSERYTVEQCKTQILADISQIADSSSHVKKVLDAIKASIENAASKEQESYEVAGRALKYKSFEELVMLKEKYEGYYAQELQACAVADGTFSRNIKVRF